MLYRKIETAINEFYNSESDKILMIIGARQVGKSFILRHTVGKLFKNFIEINLIDDFNGPRLFEKVYTTEDFYLTLGALYGEKIGTYHNTMIFLDEIQKYPHLFTLLKFLREDKRYHIVTSGSLLGFSLKSTVSVPVGSLKILRMFPLDFEEFLIANDCGSDIIELIKDGFMHAKDIPLPVHEHVMYLFKRYLLVGGMPDAVNEYIKSRNIGKIRGVQSDIHLLYEADASQYDSEHKLKITRIYNLIPSNMENKKKRLVFKDIEDKKGKRSEDYVDEVDYLVQSGITLEVKAVANPSFPLPESGKKNLFKLYMNDVGLLTAILYRNNIGAVINDESSVDLGSVYETVVAMELAAQGFGLYYYDNKKNGEVDYLIDDYANLTSLPIEVKSGKDFYVHSALNRLIDNRDYRVDRAIVLSNSHKVETKGNITYMPIYYIIGAGRLNGDPEALLL